jgi:hypothetical protein
VHWTENIVDFANQLFVCGVDHTGKKGHTVSVNHGNNFSFTGVGESCNLHNLSWGALLETTTESSTTTTTATSESTATASAASIKASWCTSSSWFKSHFDFYY